MYKNRITALHTLLDNCIAPISVTSCRTLPIEELFAGVDYQKKYQFDDSHIGSIVVSVYSDGLVDFFTKVLYQCLGDK